MERLSCPTHKKEIIAICLEQTCKVKIACSRCLVYSHRRCENVIHLEDIQNDNFDPIIDIPKVKNTPEYHNFKLLNNFTKREDRVQNIENMFVSLNDAIFEKMNKIKDSMIQSLNKELSVKNVSEKLFDFLSLQEFDSKIGTFTYEELEKELSEKFPPQAYNTIDLSSHNNFDSPFGNEIDIEKTLLDLEETKRKICTSIDEQFPFRFTGTVFFEGKRNSGRAVITNDEIKFDSIWPCCVFSKNTFEKNSNYFKFRIDISGSFENHKISFGLFDAQYNSLDFEQSVAADKRVIFSFDPEQIQWTSQHSKKCSFLFEFNSQTFVLAIKYSNGTIAKEINASHFTKCKFLTWSKSDIRMKLINYYYLIKSSFQSLKMLITSCFYFTFNASKRNILI